MKSFSRHRYLLLLVLVFLSLLAVAGASLVGIRKVPLEVVLNPFGSGVDSDIFWRIRVPRVCFSFLAGAGLAISGMVFQAMFRNPLATPFTLGVASGASFGATLYIRLGMIFSVAGISGITFSAFGGALFSVVFLYVLTRLKGGFSTATLLLAGVAMSFFFSSFILFTQYMSDFTSSFRIIRWLMGSLEVVGFASVRDVLPFVVVGTLMVFYLAHDLNILMVGEDISESRGVDVARTKRVLFFATSLMVGGIVAICGPIGFVGMMVPHICRLLIGADHRYLAPATFLFGGMFLTVCDTVARTLIAPAEMPVGIITALLGGPFFIWLLLRNPSLRENTGL